MTRSSGLRQRKNEEAKRLLYQAAMKLFQEKGFEETSIDEITERAGFSRATFFNHFGSKRGVLRYYGQEIQSLLDEMLDHTDRDARPLDLIREALRKMTSEAEKHLPELRLIYANSIQDVDYLNSPTPARRRVCEILTELVTAAQKQGRIRRDIPARELALHILSLYQGMVFAMIAGRRASPRSLESLWLFILEGVKGRKL